MRFRNIAIAMFGLVAVLVLLYAAQGTEAAEDPIPDSFYVTDVTETGFTVVWMTQNSVDGNISWGNTSTLDSWTTNSTGTIHYHNVTGTSATGFWNFTINSDGTAYQPAIADADWMANFPEQGTGNHWMLNGNTSLPPPSYPTFGNVTNLTAGDAAGVIIIVENSAGNFSSAVTNATGNFTINTLDSVGPFNMTILGAQQGYNASDNILATGAPQNLGNFQLENGPAYELEMSFPSTTVTAGVTFDGTITVVDAWGNTYDGYSDDVTFSYTGVGTSPAGPQSFPGTDTYTNGFRLDTAGSQWINVSDPANTWLMNETMFTVVPAAISSIDMVPVNSQANVSATEDFSLVFYDAYGNENTTSLDIDFVSSDLNPLVRINIFNALPYTANAVTSGTSFNIAFFTAGNQWLNASNASVATPGNNTWLVNPGALNSVVITDLFDGSEILAEARTTDANSVTYYASGYDAEMNYIGPVVGNWSWTGDYLGSFDDATDMPNVTVDYTDLGDAFLNFSDGAGHSDDTGNINITVGALNIVRIQDGFNGNNITTETRDTDNNTVTYYASGFDLDWNYVGPLSGTWTWNNTVLGTIVGSPDDNITIDYTTPGADLLNFTNASYVDSTGLITVVVGAVDDVVITGTPNGAAIGPQNLDTDNNTEAYYASGYDADDNYVGLVSGTWTWNNTVLGVITGSPNDNITVDFTTPGADLLNFTDGTNSNYTGLITVSLGALDHVVLTDSFNGIAIGLQNLDTDNNTETYFASGYDADNNYIGPMVGTWSWSGTGLGVITGSPGNNITVDYTTPGAQTLDFVNGSFSDSTDIITVSVGAVDDVVITDSANGTAIGTQTLDTDDNAETYFASGYDADDNYVGLVSGTWSWNNTLLGTITGSPGTNVSVDYNATGADLLNFTDGSNSNATGILTVSVGMLDHVRITESFDGTEIDTQPTQDTDSNAETYFASGYDADDNYVGPVSGTWSWNNTVLGVISGSPGDNVTIDFTLVGADLLNFTDGPRTDSTGVITVGPGMADHMLIAPAGGNQQPGVAFNVDVTIYDADDNVKTDYVGTVNFTSGDTNAVLPSDYLFTSPGDDGIHTFSITLDTPGTQWLNCTDTVLPMVTDITSYSVATVDQLIMNYTDYTILVTDEVIEITAMAWNNTYGVAVPGILVNFTIAPAFGVGDPVFTSPVSVVTDANGNASVTLNAGTIPDVLYFVRASEDTFGSMNMTNFFFVIDYRSDLIVIPSNNTWVGNDIYQDPPGPEQQVWDGINRMNTSIGIDGSRSFRVIAQNDGTVNDTLTLVWNNATLPADWDMTMEYASNGTDITVDGSVSMFLTRSETMEFILTIYSNDTAVWGSTHGVGLGLFDSHPTHDHDSFGVMATVYTPDYLAISMGRDEMPDILDPMSVPINVEAPDIYACLYNTTVGDEEPIGSVAGWWDLTNNSGAAGWLSVNGTAMTTMANTGPTPGQVVINVSWYSVPWGGWFNDTWTVNVSLGFNSLNMTYTPGGEEILGNLSDPMQVYVGQEITLYFSMYNDTGVFVSTFFGRFNDTGIEDKVNDIHGGGFNITIKFGPGDGIITIPFEVDLDQWYYDNITFNITPAVLDAVSIDNMVNGTEYNDWNDMVGQSYMLYASTYNMSWDDPGMRLFLPNTATDITWDLTNYGGASGSIDKVVGEETMFSTGTSGGWIHVTVSYYDAAQNLTFTDTLNISVDAPTTDYIDLCYDINGADPITEGITLTNTQFPIYMCGYNDTIGFYTLVNGTWTIENSVADSSLQDTFGQQNVFTTSTVSGSSWINYTSEDLFFDESFQFDFDVSLVIDGVQIGYANGTTIPDDMDWTVGEDHPIYCIAYNGTTPLGPAPANWTIALTGMANGTVTYTYGDLFALFNTGTRPGDISITVNYEGIEDMLNLTTVIGTLSVYAIELTDGSTPGNDYTADDSVVLFLRGYDAQGNLIGDINGDWSLSGDNGTFVGSYMGVSTVTIDWEIVGSLDVSVYYNGMTLDLPVNVAPGIIASIVITPSVALVNLTADDVVDFDATGYDADGNIVTTDFVWTTNDTAITSMVDGLFNAATAGTWNVTATNGSDSEDVVFTIATGALFDVVITSAGNTTTADDTVQFVATGRDQDGNAIPGIVFMWDTNATNATIDSTGLFTPHYVGTWSINATNGTFVGVTDIMVTPGALAAINLTAVNTTITADDAEMITATAFDANWNEITGTTYSWTTSDASGTVVGGLYTAAVAGTNTVTATAAGMSGMIAITVNPGVLASIIVTPVSATVDVSELINLTAVGYDADGNMVITTFTWTSDDASGTIADGAFTPGTAGTFAVTATSGTVSGNATITVNAPSSDPAGFGDVVKDWWWLFMILIVVLLLVILMVLRKKNEEPGAEDAEAAGAAAAAPAVAPGAAEAAGDDEHGECPTCGANIPLTSTVCPECGEEFEEDDDEDVDIEDETSEE